MRILEFLKKEYGTIALYEKIIFSCVILVISGIAIYMKDSIPALISAVCGICATILAGKGKISCYVFGMIANICYSYISFNNQFWGHLGLNMLYYIPMQFVGIAKWKNHLKKDTQEIYKSELSSKEKIIYLTVAVTAIILGYFILKYFSDNAPLIDSVTTVLSIIAFILTVKRCIEQWYVWTVVNALSMIMWIMAYMNGSNSFATILMWSVYLMLGLYFLFNWKKELKNLKS